MKNNYLIIFLFLFSISHAGEITTVTLNESIDVPIYVNGKKSGTMRICEGKIINIKSVSENKINAEYNGINISVYKGSTNYNELIIDSKNEKTPAVDSNTFNNDEDETTKQPMAKSRESHKSKKQQTITGTPRYITKSKLEEEKQETYKTVQNKKIIGDVLQITEEGAIIVNSISKETVAVRHKKNIAGPYKNKIVTTENREPIFVYGLKVNRPMQKVSIQPYYCGYYKYTTIAGFDKMVAAYAMNIDDAVDIIIKNKYNNTTIIDE